VAWSSLSSTSLCGLCLATSFGVAADLDVKDIELLVLRHELEVLRRLMPTSCQSCEVKSCGFGVRRTCSFYGNRPSPCKEGVKISPAEATEVAS
jgi:Fe-S-cluster containining protein